MTKTMGLGLLLAVVGAPPAFAADSVVQTFKLDTPVSAPATVTINVAPASRVRSANFGDESPSVDTRTMANWILGSGDSQGLPFTIVDKKAAQVFVFDAAGQLRGAAPVLLGLAIGDSAVPGIGNRPLSSIRPEERTTPAGRFVSALDRNLRGKEILWVDYDGAVSLHPVVNAKAEERRLQRLASPTPLDNRISYGCINVSVKFFDNIVRPAFTGTYGIVYVLPEVMSIEEVFHSAKAGTKTGLRAGL
jgi:hypothetical protein